MPALTSLSLAVPILKSGLHSLRTRMRPNADTLSATAILASLMAYQLPPGPTPLGILRRVEQPAFEAAVQQQIRHEIDVKGTGSLDELIRSGDVWTVGEAGAASG